MTGYSLCGPNSWKEDAVTSTCVTQASQGTGQTYPLKILKS